MEAVGARRGLALWSGRGWRHRLRGVEMDVALERELCGAGQAKRAACDGRG